MISVVILALAIAGLFVLPDPWRLIFLCIALVIEVGEVFAWIRFLRRYRVTTGAEGCSVNGPRSTRRGRAEVAAGFAFAASFGMRAGRADRPRVAWFVSLASTVSRWSSSPTTETTTRDNRKPTSSRTVAPGSVQAIGATEKGPGKGALWFRKDVPPAYLPLARRSFKSHLPIGGRHISLKH